MELSLKEFVEKRFKTSLKEVEKNILKEIRLF